MVAKMYRQEFSSKASVSIDRTEVSRSDGAAAVTTLSAAGSSTAAALLHVDASASPSPPTTFIEHESSGSSASDDDDDGVGHAQRNGIDERDGMISPPPPQIPDLSLVEGLTVYKSLHAVDGDQVHSSSFSSSVSSVLSEAMSEVSFSFVSLDEPFVFMPLIWWLTVLVSQRPMTNIIYRFVPMITILYW